MKKLAQFHILMMALLSLGSLGACSNKESLGSDNLSPAGAGGSAAQGGAAGFGTSSGASGTGGAVTGGSASTGGKSGSGGAGGTTTGVEAVDARVDAPAQDAATDRMACTGPNPAAVTCLGNSDQCVPCTCSSEGVWTCSTDCRGNLPLCDAGVGPETGATIDASASCSVTTATLSVVAGSVLDGYCFSGCGLPLRLFKDGTSVSLYDIGHPACGSCQSPPIPACVPTGIAVTTRGYTYSLSQRFDVAGKCDTQDCAAATCLAPGHYKVVYSILAKQANGTCGGTPLDLAAEFDYPQTTEVKLQFSTLPSCSRNSDCSTGQSCFHGPTSSRCIPTSQTCSSVDPTYGRCMCPDCTCASLGDYWACVT